MNRTLHWAAALCLAAGVGALSSPAVAQGAPGGGQMPPGGPGGPGMRRGPDLFEGITLTDAQKQQIEAIQKKHMAERPSQDSMRTLMEAMRTAREANDTVTLNKFRDENRAKQQEVNKELRAVLTSEQQVQFDKNVQKQEEQMKKWQGGGMGGGRMGGGRGGRGGGNGGGQQ